MNVCDLITGVGRLEKATRKLREAWLEANQTWDDRTSRDFEQKYLQRLTGQIGVTVTATYELAALFEKAERECADEGRGEI